MQRFYRYFSLLAILNSWLIFTGTAWAQKMATATATVVNGFVVQITVTDGGEGYNVAPEVTLAGGGGTGATATAAVAGGKVTQIVVNSAGAGYTNVPEVVIAAPITYQTATAEATIMSGFVIDITVKNHGAGYTNEPKVTISGGGGVGATAKAVIQNGQVTAITILNAGSGYQYAPFVTIAPPVTGTNVNDGLVLYYPFNGNALDESGLGNDGLVSGATLGTDRFGVASNSYVFKATGSFPGWTGDYISTTSGNGFPSGMEDFTFSAWVLISSNSPDYQVFFSNRQLNQFQLGITPLSGSTEWGAQYGEIWPYDGNETPLCRGVVDWTLNHWYQITYIRNANTLMLYRDGQFLTQSPINQGNQAQSADRIIDFGFRTQPANHPFWGQLDDIRLYNRALSSEEVDYLYHLESPELPWLSLQVKRIAVTLHLKPTKKYQLRASTDLKNWATVGEPFVASAAEVTQEFDVTETGRYFQIEEIN